MFGSNALPTRCHIRTPTSLHPPSIGAAYEKNAGRTMSMLEARGRVKCAREGNVANDSSTSICAPSSAHINIQTHPWIRGYRRAQHHIPTPYICVFVCVCSRRRSKHYTRKRNRSHGCIKSHRINVEVPTWKKINVCKMWCAMRHRIPTNDATSLFWFDRSPSEYVFVCM